MKILHNITTIGKSSFGLGQISVSLARAQMELNNQVEIWCIDERENIQWASKTHSFPAEFIKGFGLFGPKSLWFSPAMKKESLQNAQRFDIVHQHGIWTGTSAASLIFSKRKKIPVVVAPHGSLNKWVLNLSSWKKKIALSFYEMENLRLASCLHATSESEIADFRNFGLKNPIAYIQNGIQEKYLLIQGNAKRFREQYNISNDKRIMLFLSRISPKKGLPMLFESINSIRPEFSNWQLIIAGINEFNHKKELESLIDGLGLQHEIKIIGPLFDQSKFDAFEAAELFILPSHSEGSPMVVLDSLAAGLPVITTKASSWEDLNHYSCGWWTEIHASSIAQALKQALPMSSSELKRLGENGKKLIMLKYTWNQLAHNSLSLYQWLLGIGDKPDFVQVD